MLLYEQIVREIQSYSEEWLLGVFIIQLILIAWLNYNYPTRFRGLFKQIANRQLEKQDFGSKYDWTNTFSLAYMTIFFLSFSWLVYLVLNYFNILDETGLNQILIFILILLGSVLLYFVKLLILNIINALTPENYGIENYSYSIGQYYQFLGLVLIPILLLATFNPNFDLKVFLWIGISIYGLIYLMRVFRGIINSYLSEAQPFYIILYLCTFEILPVLMAAKYFTSYFKAV